MEKQMEICYTAGLARENGKVMTIEHDGARYYVAQIKADQQVVEERLISVDTSPGKIRTFLTEWGKHHYQIAEVAKNSIIARLSL